MASIETLLKEILSQYEKKDYAAAEKAADELIAAHPDFPRGQFLKAVILEETGRAALAEEHYAKAENRYTLWSRLAMQLHDIDPGRAIVYYERVIKADPENNTIRFMLASLYEKMGRTSDAGACFRDLQPVREALSRILIPLGFLIIMISGAFIMVKRGDRTLAFFLVLSAGVCLLWLKRDGTKAMRMWAKKQQYQK
jgi:tetratricopeptide (TPR) repeat protein